MSKVKTFEDARKLSLIKWNKVKEALMELNNLIDDECSFCDYSTYLYRKEPESEPTKLVICKRCPVESLCDKLIEIKDNKPRSVFIYYVDHLIDELIIMKEENYKSRHQLKGGE